MTILAALALVGGTGCVPLTQYNKLKKQFEGQEQYVRSHRTEVKKAESRATRLALSIHQKDLELNRTRHQLKNTKVQLASARKVSPKPATAPKAMIRESRPQPASAPRSAAVTIDGFTVNRDTNGIVLDQAVMFAPGSATLKKSGKRVLIRLAKKLNSRARRRFNVRVAGHTDSTPIRRTKGRLKDNWQLSGMRARAVLNQLEASGVSSKRLSFVGFSHHRPIVSGRSASAQRKNRRVEILLLDPTS